MPHRELKDLMYLTADKKIATVQKTFWAASPLQVLGQSQELFLNAIYI